MSSYPPSILAYPLLNQLLNSFLPFPASSTSSTFTLPSIDASSTSSSISSQTTTVTSLVSSTSTVHLPPISPLLTTTASTTLPVISSSLQSPVEMTDLTSSLHPKNAVTTSPNLQQYSAVRQLTTDLLRNKPRHPRRPQPPLDGIGPPVRRLVHTAVYKQKIAQYTDAIKLYETHHDELIQQTTLELDKINNTLPPSKLCKFKSPQSKPRHLSPLSIQIPSHNCSNYQNYFQCNTPHCSHVSIKDTIHSPLPPLSLSPALIPIRIEPITPSSQSPTPLNDLDNLVTSLNDVD